MSCILCTTRKSRRPCPAAQGDICPQCCAEQREEKLDCPLSCEFLRESRKHEKYVEVPKSATPHPEVKLGEDFLSRNDLLMQFLSVAVRDAALSTAGATDADVREAVDAVIQTLKTADSGLIYETRSANPFAASIQEKINTQIAELKRQIGERSAGATLRDKDMLGIMVFIARVSISLNNGKRKGRSFLAMLLERFPAPKSSEGQKTPEPAASPAGLIVGS